MAHSVQNLLPAFQLSAHRLTHRPEAADWEAQVARAQQLAEKAGGGGSPLAGSLSKLWGFVFRG